MTWPTADGPAEVAAEVPTQRRAAAQQRVPARVPVRWLRVAVGLLGLAAVGLSGGAGPLADLALLAGAGAALASAWLPHTPAPWGVLVAAALPRLSGAGEVTGELLAQAVAVLLFHSLAGLLAVVAAAETVELAALRPGLVRCAAAALAVLPAALIALVVGGSGSTIPAAVAGGCAAAAAALLLLLRGRG